MTWPMMFGLLGYLTIGIAWLFSLPGLDKMKRTRSDSVAIVICTLLWPIAAPVNWHMTRRMRRRAR